MTNLMRWLSYIGLFAIPYFAIILQTIQTPLLNNYMFYIQILPIILLILFGLYAATTVLYRVFTFHDCPEAEKEIQEQIIECRKDLISKGFKFRD